MSRFNFKRVQKLGSIKCGDKKMVYVIPVINDKKYTKLRKMDISVIFSFKSW